MNRVGSILVGGGTDEQKLCDLSRLRNYKKKIHSWSLVHKNVKINSQKLQKSPVMVTNSVSRSYKTVHFNFCRHYQGEGGKGPSPRKSSGLTAHHVSLPKSSYKVHFTISSVRLFNLVFIPSRLQYYFLILSLKIRTLKYRVRTVALFWTNPLQFL